MCGIAGFIDYSRLSKEEDLSNMSKTLSKRGPDGQGGVLFSNPHCQVALGHRRLSIIDLSDTGKQPMRLDNLVITFNGEIYNYKELQKELITLGHTFSGQSDTEVLLHAYQHWGSSCLTKLIGMFAFVIYDEQKRELFCARDRAGVKPFFYYWDEQIFLFASELKAFHAHPGFKKEINHDAVAAFMQYGNVPTPYCIFNHCHKLLPGHTLTFSLGLRSLVLKKYWSVYDAYNKPKLDISFDEALVETEKILSSAFEYRMVADVPVGIFLSGGYDSTCLTALLQKNKTTHLKTFTIGVEDPKLDEAPYAREIAKHLGTNHTEYYFTEKELLQLVPSLPINYDEPFGDQSALPTMLVSNVARKQVTVALSADAGDEIFAGYNRYDYLLKYGQLLNAIPPGIRNVTAKTMGYISADSIPILNKKYNFHNRYEKLKQLLKDPSPKNMMLSMSTQFTDMELVKLVVHPFQNSETAYLSHELKHQYYSPLSYMMAIDYQTYLLDDILQKVDRASMSQSLEAREPFLDHRIIEWAARLPDQYKYYKGTKKYLIREIVHQYIPRQMMNRPKMGFSIPLENWLTLQLREQVMYYLDTSRIKNQNIFDPETVEQIKLSFLSGKKELVQKIWYLLMFQMWYDKWM